MNELCHCGLPLHYTNKAVENQVKKIIQAKGSRFIEITQLETGRTFKVDSHYVALHGVEANLLDTYGFEEIKNEV